MRTLLIWLATLAVLCSPLAAQIESQEQYAFGDMIAISWSRTTLVAPTWTVTPAPTKPHGVKSGGRWLFCWLPPGSYTVKGTTPSATSTVTILVGEPAPPVIEVTASLVAEPEAIKAGEPVALVWRCEGAKSATMNGASVELTGTQILKPTVTTTYTLVATGEDGKTATAQRVVTVTDTPPPPEPVSGFHVLIVYDPLMPGITDQQRTAYANAINAKIVRDYLSAKCVKGASGAPAFRVAKPDADFSRDEPIWGQALKVPHPNVTVPYVVASNPPKGVVAALSHDDGMPLTPDELLKLLKDVGGE